MADKKISELAALSTADVADVVPIVDVSEGVTHKITKQNLLSGHQHTLSDITDSGTAAGLDVPSSGDASTSEVVKGNDTRLTDARTPTTHNHSAAAINAGVLGVTYGGTGLNSLGSAGQVLKVNSSGTALEYASDNTDGEGGGSGEANKNAWSNFTVGSDTVSADTTTDTAVFSSGTTELTISANTATDTIEWGLSIGTAANTIAAGDHTHTLSTSAAGLAAALPSSDASSKFLRGDNTWSVPPDTTYSVTSTSAAGLAPQLPSTSSNTFLKDDGTWSTPADNDTTYTAASGGGLSLSATAFSLDLSNTNAWTGSQRSALVTDNDGSFDMDAGQNFKCTPTAAVNFTFTNITDGQSGYILLVNGSAYTHTKSTTLKASSTLLTDIGAAGTFLVSYIADGTNVYLTNSQALS